MYHFEYQPDKPLHLPSSHFIFYALNHVIINYWGMISLNLDAAYGASHIRVYIGVPLLWETTILNMHFSFGRQAHRLEQRSGDANPKESFLTMQGCTQRVHIGIWYILRAQRGSHIPTLRPKYIPYSYMDPLGVGFRAYRV